MERDEARTIAIGYLRLEADNLEAQFDSGERKDEWSLYQQIKRLREAADLLEADLLEQE